MRRSAAAALFAAALLAPAGLALSPRQAQATEAVRRLHRPALRALPPEPRRRRRVDGARRRFRTGRGRG